MLAMNASRAASMVDTRAIGVKDLNDDGDDHDDASRAHRRLRRGSRVNVHRRARDTRLHPIRARPRRGGRV